MSAADHILAIDGVDYPLEIRRHARARRVLLRFARGSEQNLILTLPKREPLGPALRWAAGQGDFIRRSVKNRPAPIPFVDGGIFMVEGDEVVIDWQSRFARVPVIDNGRLVVGGPMQFVAGRIERWLKARALERLSAESREMARVHDLTIGRISIGDPKGRWGSCANNGNIRYSWRLILAPVFVRRAVVAHEVAHLAHPNHGREFHNLVDLLLGESARPAYAWLRRHGAGLHWVGRLG